jgi:hypothetical protein
MKKLIVAIFAVMLVGTVTAQRFSHGGGVAFYHPRVIVTGGYYPYWGMGFGPFYPYGPYDYGYYNRPSKMDLQIQDIKNDYADKIWSAKHDTSLSRRDRRLQVHELKVERDKAIYNLRRNYYKN